MLRREMRQARQLPKQLSRIAIGTCGMSNSLSNGMIATVYLKLPENAEVGTAYLIKIQIDTICDKSGYKHSASTTDGWIVVGNPGTPITNWVEPASNQIDLLHGDSLLGDVNGDKVVNCIDANLALQAAGDIMCDLSPRLTDEQLRVADYNQDNILESKDSAYILIDYVQALIK